MGDISSAEETNGAEGDRGGCWGGGGLNKIGMLMNVLLGIWGRVWKWVVCLGNMMLVSEYGRKSYEGAGTGLFPPMF